MIPTHNQSRIYRYSFRLLCCFAGNRNETLDRHTFERVRLSDFAHFSSSASNCASVMRCDAALMMPPDGLTSKESSDAWAALSARV